MDKKVINKQVMNKNTDSITMTLTFKFTESLLGAKAGQTSFNQLIKLIELCDMLQLSTVCGVC